MGVDGDKTFTTDPVLDVRATEVIGTLKLRKEVPAGAASVTVTLKFAVPGGGGTLPPTGPLQELSESTASTIKSPRGFRFMWYPTQDDDPGEGARVGWRSPGLFTYLSTLTRSVRLKSNQSAQVCPSAKRLRELGRTVRRVIS